MPRFQISKHLWTSETNEWEEHIIKTIDPSQEILMPHIKAKPRILRSHKNNRKVAVEIEKSMLLLTEQQMQTVNQPQQEA